MQNAPFLIKKLNDSTYCWKLILMLYVALLPFGTALVNITFVAILCVWFFEAIITKIRLTRKDIFLIVIFSGYYIFNIISISYSENINMALKKISLQSFLLLFPLVIISKKKIIDKKFYIELIEVFSLSLTVLSAASMLNQYFKYIKAPELEMKLFLENNLSTSVVDYYFLGLSLALSFSLVVNFYVYSFQKNEFSKWYLKVYYICNAILLITLVLLNSRTVLFLTAIIFLIITIKKGVKEKRIMKPLLGLSTIVVIVVLNWKFNTIFNTKVQEAIEYNSENNWGGRGMRFSIWDCTINVIQDNKLFGVGIGDQQDELTLCYKIYMKDQLLLKGRNYNAHNIFLQITLSVGILGLLLFLLSFIYPFIKSINNNPFYICFITVFIISGLTESYLERNVNIAFFSFFNVVSFFAIQNENITDTQ